LSSRNHRPFSQAAAFGTGTRTTDGITKTLYPSTNTSAVYVLPFRRADDGLGVRRLIIASKLSGPVHLTLQGGFCDTGKCCKHRHLAK